MKNQTSDIKIKDCTAINTVTVDRTLIISLLNKVDDMKCWLRGFEAGGGSYNYDLSEIDQTVNSLKGQVYHGNVE